MMNFSKEVLDMKKEVENVKEESQSFAMQFVETLKKQNQRLFICWIITFLAFIGLLTYTIYLMNDIGTITTEISQDTETGYNNYIGNDGEIING